MRERSSRLRVYLWVVILLVLVLAGLNVWMTFRLRALKEGRVSEEEAARQRMAERVQVIEVLTRRLELLEEQLVRQEEHYVELEQLFHESMLEAREMNLELKALVLDYQGEERTWLQLQEDMKSVLARVPEAVDKGMHELQLKVNNLQAQREELGVWMHGMGEMINRRQEAMTQSLEQYREKLDLLDKVKHEISDGKTRIGRFLKRLEFPEAAKLSLEEFGRDVEGMVEEVADRFNRYAGALEQVEADHRTSADDVKVIRELMSERVPDKTRFEKELLRVKTQLDESVESE